MAYVKTAWVNNAAPPLNATNLNNIEAGIFNAADSGIIEVDGYTGTDDQKLTSAIAAQQADTYKRTMRLSNRRWDFTQVRDLYTGFKLTGSGGGAAVEQPRTGNPYATFVHIATGSGNPWLRVNSAQVFGCYVGNMSLEGDSTSGFLGSTSNTNVLWTSVLENLGFSAFSYVLGSHAQRLPLTLCTFQGYWNINNSYTTAIHIQGSDNTLWPSGCLLDSGDAFTSTSIPYHAWFDYLEKTYVGPMFITCERWPAGIRITGNDSSGALVLNGLKVEGRNSTEFSYGSVVRMEGGRATFRDCWFSYGYGNYAAVDTEVINRTGEGGVVTVTGGRALFDGCWYSRAIAETTPWIYASGATTKVRIRNAETAADGGAFTGLPRVQAAGGATLDYDNSVTVV